VMSQYNQMHHVHHCMLAVELAFLVNLSKELVARDYFVKSAGKLFFFLYILYL